MFRKYYIAYPTDFFFVESLVGKKIRHIFDLRRFSMLVNDKMQQGYEYFYTVPEGEMFADDFKPELTPRQMLELGVFEGHY